MTGFRYNHDLLLRKSDRVAAEGAFRAIFPALDHEELRRRFEQVNVRADRMKASSRRLGIASIFLVVFALMGASTAHITEHLPAARLVAGLSTLAGLIGVLIGGFGVMHSRRKARWLLCRFEGERLRQFFFQTLVVLAPEIIAAAESGGWQDFRAKRAASFKRFEQELDAELEAQFDLALRDAASAAAPAGRWLLRSRTRLRRGKESPGAEQLREAYRHLRLNGQRAFAQNRLLTTGAWFPKQPADQLRFIKWAGGGAILLTVVLHLLVAAGVLRAWGADVRLGWLHIGAIWLAILALAIRTFEEGLQPGREIERYRAYRDGARNILERFDAARTMGGTLAAMREMEELGYSEMIAFLKSSQEATFTM